MQPSRPTRPTHHDYHREMIVLAERLLAACESHAAGVAPVSDPIDLLVLYGHISMQHRKFHDG